MKLFDELTCDEKKIALADMCETMNLAMEDVEEECCLFNCDDDEVLERAKEYSYEFSNGNLVRIYSLRGED